MQLIIYSLKAINGKYTVCIDHTSLIREVVHGSHIMIDAPVTGLKKFVWYPYMVKQHIFDNGHVFFMIAGYKKLKAKWVLKYLMDYLNAGRKNKKNYLQV